MLTFTINTSFQFTFSLFELSIRGPGDDDDYDDDGRWNVDFSQMIDIPN